MKVFTVAQSGVGKRSELSLFVSVLVICAALGWFLIDLPWLPVFLGISCGSLILIAVALNAENWVLSLLAIMILGYAVQGRGFAYLGIHPVYVGEVVLLLLVLSAPFLKRNRANFPAISWLISAFMALGFSRTLPYLGRDGLDAIRDAVIWYYAAFALILASILTHSRIQAGLSGFARLVPWIMLWFVIMSTIVRSVVMPHVPTLGDAPLPLVSVMTSGNRAVVMVALAVFVSSGLYKKYSPRASMSFTVFWAMWLICFVIVAAEGRGGFLAIALGLAAGFVLNPSREILRLAGLGGGLLVLALLLNPQVDLGANRVVSPRQVTVNLLSIVSEESPNEGNVQQTKSWRLDFWRAVFDDIVVERGPLFGRGFGANLADYYGFQLASDSSLRSPHNAHVTILARMGIPGLILWITLNLAFATHMVAGYRRARRIVDPVWPPSIYLWILTIWVAMSVEAGFDVYYEAPHGGILFWCLIGFGLAVVGIESANRTESGRRPLEHHSR